MALSRNGPGHLERGQEGGCRVRRGACGGDGVVSNGSSKSSSIVQAVDNIWVLDFPASPAHPTCPTCPLNSHRLPATSTNIPVIYCNVLSELAGRSFLEQNVSQPLFWARRRYLLVSFIHFLWHFLIYRNKIQTP
jgi:hypothetical protein